MTPDQLPEGGRVLYRALHAIHQANISTEVTDMAERGLVEFFKTPEPTILSHKSLDPPNRWDAFTDDELEDMAYCLGHWGGDSQVGRPYANEIRAELARRKTRPPNSC